MSLGLLFTYGVSLATWKHAGYLEREIKYYRALAEALGGVTFVTYGGPGESGWIGDSGIRTISNTSRLPAPIYALGIPFRLRGGQSDIAIVKSNQISGAWVGPWCRRVLGCAFVARAGFVPSEPWRTKGRHPLRRGWIRLQDWLACREADVVIVTSERARSFLTEVYGLPVEKVAVVPNFVDLDLFRPMTERRLGSHKIGTVARFTDEKNLGDLIRAAALLDHVELVLVGDGAKRAELEILAERLGVRASFLGTVAYDRLPALLNSFGAFVIPSRFEGQPKALLEAMACGLPCVGTPVPGIQELIVDGKTGFLAPSVTPEGIAAAIERLFQDADRAVEVGRRASEFVAESFSLEEVVARELHVYRERGFLHVD